MLPLKDTLISKMTKSLFQLFCSALLVLTLVSNTCAEPKYRTPARILAKQTGATQFEEERYETHTNCNEHKHHLRKRASDEDVDYEVYQGVVGRPGIDFPIYPRIPKTTFSCRSFGNGYFADMETDCQVFHICEEGRKISFLCPNGTIFHQSELTCDWWFKVNCLGSSGYYAESSEILNKQRVHRVRPSVPVQGFNIVGGGLNYKPKVAVGQARTKSTTINAAGVGKSDRRIDSTEEVHSLETVDFEDVSGEKQRKVLASIDNNSDDSESQITAESASFVGSNGGKRRNNYEESAPKAVEQQPKPVRRISNADRNGSGSQKNGHNASTERARNGQRGQQRFKEKSKDSNDRGNNGISTGVGSVESSVESKKPFEKLPDAHEKPEFYEVNSVRNIEKLQTTTPNLATGTYTTARRFESTRSTPFYTPTIPSISKSKSTEGKLNYIKGQGGVGLLATTPSPNRFSLGAGSGLFLESSAAPKPTASAGDVFQTDSAYKPIIIGMRHHYDVGSSAELVDIGLNANSPLSGEQPAKSLKSKSSSNSKDYLPTTTSAPRTTGPTYLPKSGAAPKSIDGSGGDELLFAPNPLNSESIPRNVQDMLKTMNLLKNNFDDVEVNFKAPAREGLEIPPSSGPDALVSLAKYFAQEHNDSTSKTLNSLDKDNEQKLRLPVKPPTASAASSLGSVDVPVISQKPSDTTTSITTPGTPLSISNNADDIKASLLSQKTVNKYADLFGLKDPKAKEGSGSISDGLLTGINATKSNGDSYNAFPQIGSTGSAIRELAEKPESRKIAQVFSNALNNYLKDPQTLRAELAAARPTEPPNFTPVTNPDTDYFSEGTARTYLPTKPTPDYSTTTSNIAAEINNKFDFSTVAQDYTTTTEVYDSTTYRIPKERQHLEFSAELAPPSADSGEDDEVLHRLQTQSFVKPKNDLAKSPRKQKPEKLIDATKPTEHPWTLKSQTDFLDPLTINDGLMKERLTTTQSPFTYQPKEAYTTILPSIGRPNGHIKLLGDAAQRGRGASVEQHNNGYEWDDIFSSYDIPREALPSSTGLQRIANKLFGGLNEQEALHLKSVMAHAEHNRQVLSLLLLLIQTCDDQNGKALERSRKHLLNALIDIDSKLQRQQATVSKTSALKEAPPTTTVKAPTPTTTLRPAVTTFRRGDDDLYASTTPATPITTTELPISTTTFTTGVGNEETTKFEIRVEDPEDEYNGSTNAPTVVNTNSDRRALELLKSLYSLASKFSSRR